MSDMKAWHKKRGYGECKRDIIESFQFMDRQFWPKGVFFERRRREAFDKAQDLVYKAALRESIRG